METSPRYLQRAADFGDVDGPSVCGIHIILGFAYKPGEPSSPVEAVAELDDLKRRLAAIESKLRVGEEGAEPGQVPKSIVSAFEKKAPSAQVPAGRQGAER